MSSQLHARKIFVACPGGLTTGGAELLHQLVDELRRNSVEAFISYWPFAQKHPPPSAYKKYDAPVADIEDREPNLVIFPEVLTRSTNDIRRAACAVWWLSVDNYFIFPQNYRLGNPLRVYHRNSFYNPLRRLKTLILYRRPLSSMRNLAHFAQSHYAKTFLANSGIQARMLTDYLSEEHFLPTGAARSPRRDVVAYNPKKGIEITRTLIDEFPDIQFSPIVNMTASQVADFLRSVKLYIDFGHHPGKDRPPREAAMAGCCVITGSDGAAAHVEDIPIPSRYRMNPEAKDFKRQFGQTVREVFVHFDARNSDFNEWRTQIRGEHALFKSQVAALLC